MNRAAKPSHKPMQQTSPAPVTQPTDTYVQPFLKELIPELKSLESLRDAERRMDVYISRKKIDLHQSITQWTYQKQRDYSESQFLRVFISTIAENQPWQTNSDDLDQGTWTLRIEGRLVNDENVQVPTRPKFSTFLQSIALDFHGQDGRAEDGDGDQLMDDEGVPAVMPQRKYDIVEWHADPNTPVEFDGLDIKRQGTENVDCTITIQPKGYSGDQLQYSDALAFIIGVARGTVHEAIYSLYKYILLNELLVADPSGNAKSTQNDDKMVIKVDAMIAKLLPPAAEPRKYLKLTELPQVVNAHIKPIPPVRINYTIQVDKTSTYGELVFDIRVPRVPVKDPEPASAQNSLAQQGMLLLTEFNTVTSQLEPQLATLEKKTQLLSLQLSSTANKYQFFNKLADDPVPMLNDYIKATSNALKVLSGDDGFDEDTVRRSNFYQENEAVLFENLGVLLSNGRM
ncbi:AAR060Cp [Eremothecium gossypii ATCC 10895]|uniref:AAR060Cp n=2 Tax=Eremothecium gossypii TaxID=33169 RepID=Q75EL9_EREGS|nr:AAR060Cp [Eremothecium gossypii ATCC 10895]AAS50425.1 AAR060Cp [Eremothecium gossypii ATCC 10895]AEY94711.1 FAAR060Cp [Eremothecium gossypii FDAG1]